MNPQDVIKLNIPLLLRVMEYSKEEAKSDEDLHKVIERLTKASEGGKILTMSDYKTIIGEDFMFEGIKKKLQESRLLSEKYEDDLHEGVSDLDQVKKKSLNDRTPRDQAFINAYSKKKSTAKVNVHIKHEDGKISKHSFKVVGKQTPDEIADGHLKNLQYIHDKFPNVSGSRAKEIHKVELKESVESPADSYKKNFTERPATNSINDDDHYIYHPETKMTQRLSKRSTPEAIKKHLDAANAHKPGHIAIKGMRLKFRE